VFARILMWALGCTYLNGHEEFDNSCVSFIQFTLNLHPKSPLLSYGIILNDSLVIDI
jgi:hypothetical protein